MRPHLQFMQKRNRLGKGEVVSSILPGSTIKSLKSLDYIKHGAATGSANMARNGAGMRQAAPDGVTKSVPWFARQAPPLCGSEGGSPR